MQTLPGGVWAQGVGEDSFGDSKSLVMISGQAETEVRCQNHGKKYWRTSFGVMGKNTKNDLDLMWCTCLEIACGTGGGILGVEEFEER